MKVKLDISLLIILLLSIISCSDDSDFEPKPKPNPFAEYEVETIIPSGNEKFMTINSDYIFDQNELHTFELRLPDSSLALIDADPKAEQYVEGTLIFQGETISPVGIRYKGSVGAFSGCINKNNKKKCTKLSIKVKINWNGTDTKFFGLKKLQFHSQNNDKTQMHERLGYWLFREFGVPAPRSVHAKLIINGEYSGIYALTEQIDGRFTRFNFNDGKGNLYKEIWPIDMQGNPFDDYTYLQSLKTNEDENPKVDIIKNFGHDLANAEPDELKNVIESRMYIDEIIAYAVVDRMIRNDDGAFHWYCLEEICASHNFYWYEEPNNNKLHLIPWDLDNAFENIKKDNNSIIAIGDKWGEKSNNYEPYFHGFTLLKQRSAACDKLTFGWTSYQEKYEQLKNDFINGPFSEFNTTQLINEWSDQIREATIEAQNLHDDALKIEKWEEELIRLRNHLDYARGN